MSEFAFLAWIRTALTLLVAAILVVGLDLPIDDGWTLGVSGLLLMLAVAAAAQGLYSWRIRSRSGEPAVEVTDLRVGAWVSWGVVAAAMLLLVGWIMT